MRERSRKAGKKPAVSRPADVGLEEARLTSTPAVDGLSSGPRRSVIDRAVDMGLMTANTHQVGARLPAGLLEQAKKHTGITSTTDLLTFALASVAVDDDFGKAFVDARGKLDPDLDIGF